MGEISKDPLPRLEQITEAVGALRMLIKLHGIANLVRYVQYAAEAEAKDLDNLENPRHDLRQAKTLLEAVNTLEAPYEAIRYGIRS